MNTIMLGMLAETAIHPGAGRSTGFVDLPVAREAATDYPVIVGSSLKGALRERISGEADASQTEQIFGKHDHAGGVLFSDARLLLLPIRSLTGSYRWVTCPHLLERFERDRRRAGFKDSVLPDGFSAPTNEQVLSNTVGETIFLEERQFTSMNLIPEGVERAIAPLFQDPSARKRLPRQLVILSDDDFAWFARYGLSVVARNVLEEGTKKSINLWYEEVIPADALFYTILHERSANSLDPLHASLESNPYARMGGNETVGQGWFALTIHSNGGD